MALLDMTLWNRVQYPSRRTVLLSVRDTVGVTLLVGICSGTVIGIVSKIVATTVGAF